MPSTFGERLREIRKSLKLTQTEFGNLFGLSHPHISNVENGRDNPSEMFIRFIIEKLNVDEQWLRTGISQKDSHRF